MRPLLLLLAAAIPASGGDEPADLVGRLGAKAFADREAAEKALRALGPKALPAVRAGCASPDAEVSRRSKALREQIRADWRAAYRHDPKTPHPTWERFVAMAGDSDAGRVLYGQLIANPETFARLDDAADDPDRAKTHYLEYVADIARRRNDLLHLSFRVDVWPGDAPAELATMLFLGACFAGDPWPARTDSNTTHLPIFVSGKPFRGPAGDPLKKLFVAWLDRRADEALLRSGLDTVFCHALADGLPLARRVAADTKLTAKTRAAALPVLGRLGTATDDAACTPLLADETLFAAFDTNGYLPRETAIKSRTVQVRDVAAAVALSLRGIDPRTHGFTAADEPTWREYLVCRYESFTTQATQERAPGTTKEVPKDALLWPPAHGFEKDAERDAAHAKVKETLAKVAK